jgi:putative ATP-binding cassette transporter
MTSAVRTTLARFLRISKPYFIAGARRQALALLAALLVLLLMIAGLNVGISYVGRDFMTALARRQPHQVYLFALMYLGVFAASAAAGAFAKFFELLLGLRWREWLTERFVRQYLTSQAYFRVNAHAEVDNPDERISEDLRTFTSTALSFLVMVTNSVITLVAFIGVLWSITPWLVAAGVLYPLLGTSLIVVMGRHLVQLNNLQLKKEADFRFELVHVRTHAESVALVQSERKAEGRLGQRLGALVANYRSIISVLRNLQFVRGGYDYMDQLIPVLIVAPMYMHGEVEFGVVTQAAMVFSQVFNAFSLIAEQFQDLSAFAAVVGRVGTLDEAIAESADTSRQPIQVAEAETPLAYQKVTLRNPQDDRPLVQDLSFEVPRGKRVLLTGPNSTGKSALLRAAAGLWAKGSGSIKRPARQRVMFLPEQPYLVPGTLRDQFLTAPGEAAASDDRILDVLRKLHLDNLIERLGGLDAEHDWECTLSLGQRQLIAYARLLVAQPDFAFLDDAASALSESRRAEVYHLLADTGTSYLSVGDRQPSMLQSHDTAVDLHQDGTWSSGPAKPGRE